MMDVLTNLADQSRNAQSPEGLLRNYRPDLIRASRRRDLAIGRDGLPARKLKNSLCRRESGIEAGAVNQHPMHHDR